MGAFWCSRIETIGTLGELTGYKSGLALSRSEIVEHLPSYAGYVVGDDHEILRIRSEVYQGMTAEILYRVGNIPTPRPSFPGIGMYHKYKEDPKKLALSEAVCNKLFLEMFPAAKAKAERAGGPIDLTPFVEEAERRYGAHGLKMSLEFVEELEVFLHVTPWSDFRREKWVDTAQLADLYRSESLATYYGHFFDQRFIDYLHRNFERIDAMNWRKFEGLTCEFFERAGFSAEIGKGRNDDSIDARIWPHLDKKGTPPLVLVQCKRQKDKVGKVVVKALWADIQAEHARSGLIVTTSSLSPGAAALRTARAYPIREANRETLKRWIKAMRSPNTGVFMGE